MDSEVEKLKSRICIVGPDPKSTAAGGIATHLRVLSKLEVFKDAVFCQVRGRNGPLRGSWPEIISDFKRLRIALKSADVILFNSSISPGSLAKLAFQLFLIFGFDKKKVFVFFHGGAFRENTLSWRAVCLILRFLGRKVSTYFFLSKKQRDSFLQIFPSFNAQQYRNFADASNLLERLDGGALFRILYVGRVTADKGVFELLMAFDVLSQIQPDRFQLVIVGDGDALDKMKMMASRLGDAKVDFMGFLQGEKLEEQYRRAGVVVLVSRAEGFPYVFIESMRAGVPMIVTPVGALPDLVVEGETGYFVTQDYNEIVEKILLVEEHCRLSKKFREACYEKFKSTLSVDKAEKFYGELLKSA